MKHTPGPWKQEKRTGHALDGDRIVITAEGVDRLAVVSRNGVPDAETAQGNADLITAAPKLKRALEEFMMATTSTPLNNGLWKAYNEGRELLDQLNGIETDEEKE